MRALSLLVVEELELLGFFGMCWTMNHPGKGRWLGSGRSTDGLHKQRDCCFGCFGSCLCHHLVDIYIGQCPELAQKKHTHALQALPWT